MPRNANYEHDLLADLRNDADFSAAYLSAAMADSREAFLVLAGRGRGPYRRDRQSRQRSQYEPGTLYRTLSVEGNPRFSALESLLGALGMNLTVKLKAPTASARRAAREAPARVSRFLFGHHFAVIHSSP